MGSSGPLRRRILAAAAVAASGSGHTCRRRWTPMTMMAATRQRFFPVRWASAACWRRSLAEDFRADNWVVSRKQLALSSTEVWADFQSDSCSHFRCWPIRYYISFIPTSWRGSCRLGYRAICSGPISRRMRSSLSGVSGHGGWNLDPPNCWTPTPGRQSIGSLAAAVR